MLLIEQKMFLIDYIIEIRTEQAQPGPAMMLLDWSIFSQVKLKFQHLVTRFKSFLYTFEARILIGFVWQKVGLLPFFHLIMCITQETLNASINWLFTWKNFTMPIRFTLCFFWKLSFIRYETDILVNSTDFHIIFFLSDPQSSKI